MPNERVYVINSGMYRYFANRHITGLIMSKAHYRNLTMYVIASPEPTRLYLKKHWTVEHTGVSTIYWGQLKEAMIFPVKEEAQAVVAMYELHEAEVLELTGI